MKRTISAEMKNAIVWLERQPGVVTVTKGRYQSTRHRIPVGSGKVLNADAKGVQIRVFDQKGCVDMHVHQPQSALRDRWVALMASGNPFGTETDQKALLAKSIQPKTGPEAANVYKPQALVAVTDQTCQVFDVTPDLAAKWLEHNTRNRDLRDSVVKRYAADMKAGLWLVSPDAIAFDRNGAIVEGQHRLWAVLESGCTIRMNVMFNLEPEVIKVLGDHLKRNMVDVARINRPGMAMTTRHAAVANLLLQTSIISVAVDRRQALERITRQAQLQSLERHWDAIEFAVRECFRSTSMRGVVVAPVLTPVARAYYTQDRERLRAFGKIMLSGYTEDNKADQAAVLLRNFLVRGLTSGTKATADVVYRKTERALAAFLESTPLSTLYEASSELFPLPEDAKPRGR